MKWELWLMRHGTAESFGSKPDGERRLIELGIRESASQGAELARDGRRFDAIVSSPLPRALETAIEVASAIGFEGDIKTDDRLAIAIDLEEIVSTGREIAEEMTTQGRKKPAVLLVGHNPSMGELKSLLLSDLSDYSFKKAAVYGFAMVHQATKLVDCDLINKYSKPKV